MAEIGDFIAEQRKLLQDSLTWRGLSKRSRLEEYARIELKLSERFNKAKTVAYSPSKIEIEGFVNRLAGERRKFILRPSLAATDGILCDAGGIRNLPADYELVRVGGYRTLERPKLNLASSDVIEVEDVEPTHLPTEYLKPEISLHDASEILLEGLVDPPTEVGMNILLSLTSSPKDRFRLGGLTSTLMPREENIVHSTWDFLQDLERIIPPDLTVDRKANVRIRGAGRFEINPFSWRVLETTSSEVDSRREDALLRRPTGHSFNELTVGVSASTLAPKTLEDLWIRRADLPVMVDVPLQGMRTKGYDLDFAKYLITAHMNFPHIGPEIESNLKPVNNRLAKLRRKYDRDGFGGLIDFDVRLGSPRSVLHLAQSLARATGAERVDETLLEEALSLFVESREKIFESWEDREVQYGTVPLREQMKSRTGTTRQIYEHIVKYQNPDISVTELMEAYPRKQRAVIEESLSDLVQMGAIYQTSAEDDRYSAYVDSR